MLSLFLRGLLLRGLLSLLLGGYGHSPPSPDDGASVFVDLPASFQERNGGILQALPNRLRVRMKTAEREKGRYEDSGRRSRIRGSFGGSKRFLTSVIVFTALLARSFRRHPKNSLATSSIVSVAPARSNHLITIRGFYTTRWIMCQRFSSDPIHFFRHSLYIEAMRSLYFVSMTRRLTFIVGVSSPSSRVSSEGSSRNFFTVS